MLLQIYTCFVTKFELPTLLHYQMLNNQVGLVNVD